MPDTPPPAALPDLAAIGAPIAEALVPGWTIQWEWCAPDAMPLPDALAVCCPTPTRSMAHVSVVTPWPETESLAETLWHELTHAAWSPVMALLPLDPGAVMLVEQITERFGVLLAGLSAPLARVVARATREAARGPGRKTALPQAYERLLERTAGHDVHQLLARADDEDDDEDEDARLGARGGTMTPEMATKAVEIVATKNAKGALDLVTSLLVEALGGSGAETEVEVEADPAADPMAGKVPLARALVTLAARAAPGLGFARKLHALAGGASLDESEGKIRAALQDAKDTADLAAKVARLDAAEKKRAEGDADTALSKKLAAAVRARKYTRAELFDIAEKDGAEVLTPKAWTREMSPSSLDAMIAAKLARLGADDPPPVPEDKPVHISAAVRAYARRRGITDEKKIAALAASMGAPAPQENR